MKRRDRWRFTAQAPADEYFTLITRALWFYEAIIAVVLGAMAYWGAPLKWIVVVSAVLVVHTIGGFVFDGVRRVEGLRLILQERGSEPGRL